MAEESKEKLTKGFEKDLNDPYIVQTRKQKVKEGSINLEDQRKYIQKLLHRSNRCFNLWQYFKHLQTIVPPSQLTVSSNLQFLQAELQSDPSNYHLWAHFNFLIDQRPQQYCFQIFKLAEVCLDNCSFISSALHIRQRIISQFAQIVQGMLDFQKQIKLVINCIQKRAGIFNATGKSWQQMPLWTYLGWLTQKFNSVKGKQFIQLSIQKGIISSARVGLDIGIIGQERTKGLLKERQLPGRRLTVQQ